MGEKSSNINGQVLPLSPVQKGMIFHYIHKKDRIYMEQMICDIIGDLDVAIFERTVNKLIELHDSLRSIYLYRGVETIKQVVMNQRIINLDYRDISEVDDYEDYVNKCIDIEADKNFDLSKETFRLNLFKVSNKKFIFLCTYHHLIIDAWAIKILGEQFCNIYYCLKEGKPISYEKYSYKLYLDWIHNQKIEKTREYWKSYLSNYAPPNTLRIPDNHSVKRKNVIEVVFGTNTKSLIDKISGMYKTTINAIILAIWGAYILDHYQREELILGCIVFGRLIPLKNIDKIVGLFVNSIPLYINRKMNLKELANKLQKDTFAASPYSYISLSDMMECGNLKPLDICTFVNFSIDSKEVNNKHSDKLPFRIKNIRYNEEANYDVYLDVFIDENGLSIKIHYDMDKYYFDKIEMENKINEIIEFFSTQPEMSVHELLNSLSVMGIEADFTF